MVTSLLRARVQVAVQRLEHERRPGDGSGFRRSRRPIFGTTMYLLALQKPGNRYSFSICRPNTGASYFDMEVWLHLRFLCTRFSVLDGRLDERSTAAALRMAAQTCSTPSEIDRVFPGSMSPVTGHQSVSGKRGADFDQSVWLQADELDTKYQRVSQEEVEEGWKHVHEVSAVSCMHGDNCAIGDTCQVRIASCSNMLSSEPFRRCIPRVNVVSTATIRSYMQKRPQSGARRQLLVCAPNGDLSRAYIDAVGVLLHRHAHIVWVHTLPQGDVMCPADGAAGDGGGGAVGQCGAHLGRPGAHPDAPRAPAVPQRPHHARAARRPGARQQPRWCAI